MLASREAGAPEREAARAELERFLRRPGASAAPGAARSPARSPLEPTPPLGPVRGSEAQPAPGVSKVAPPPPVPEMQRDPRAGTAIVPSGIVAIDPATGARLIDVGNGWLDPATGRFVPKR